MKEELPLEGGAALKEELPGRRGCLLKEELPWTTRPMSLTQVSFKCGRCGWVRACSMSGCVGSKPYANLRPAGLKLVAGQRTECAAVQPACPTECAAGGHRPGPPGAWASPLAGSRACRAELVRSPLGLTGTQPPCGQCQAWAACGRPTGQACCQQKRLRLLSSKGA